MFLNVVYASNYRPEALLSTVNADNNKQKLPSVWLPFLIKRIFLKSLVDLHATSLAQTLFTKEFFALLGRRETRLLLKSKLRANRHQIGTSFPCQLACSLGNRARYEEQGCSRTVRYSCSIHSDQNCQVAAGNKLGGK